MATSTELTAALARAHAQVRAIDWSTWQVPPGGGHITFYGKDFTRIGDTTNLRPTEAG